MMVRTHMAIGFLAGLIAFAFFKINPFVFIPLAVLGAMLPDVDHENSKINKMLPLTRWIPKFFQHRGFFHSIFPVLILFCIFSYAKLQVIGIPLAIGYLSRLASDCLTRLGCNLLYPLSTFRVQGFVWTDSMMEFIIFASVILLNILLLTKQVVF